MTGLGTYKDEKLLTFRHGIHPEEYKEWTDQKPIERMPFAEEYILPLSQHIGAPSVLLVQKGQQVRRGDLIAEPKGFVSVGLHAPVDGQVVDIGLYEHPSGQQQPAIRIKTDPFSTQQLQQPSLPDPFSLDLSSFIEHIQRAGIVGLGGAAFPAHVKFSIPEGKECKYLMLNGCECEPFLTCDHRVMVEYARELIDGLAILQHFIQAEGLYIAIEANKPDAIRILKEESENYGLDVEVVPLRVKYPQGAEKMMIDAILDEEVPAGKLPIDIGILVSNVGTIAAISQYFRNGQPLFERVITVTGSGVNRPANILVPIGTSMREVIEFCGGMKENAARILLGGPMMGVVQKSLDAPVVKGTSGILVLTEEEVADITTYNCIRCGRCLDACPLFLNPARLGLLAKNGLWDEMEENNVMDCFECGSCSFICPSGIPLVQSIKIGKSIVREKRKRE